MFHTRIYKRYSSFNILTRSYSRGVKDYLRKNPELLEIKQYIPDKYLKTSSKIANEYLYLICPNAAHKIADHVVSAATDNQIIAETNTGLGLITTELLEKGIQKVRMYESCSEFRVDLKNFATVYPGRVELFIKNLFHLSRFAYMDKQDGMNRVSSLLKGVPRKAWTDDPAITVIGTMPNLRFLRYLMASLALQSGPVLYGRMQLYAIMKKTHYQTLTATPKQNLRLYRHTTVLFQLLFDYETLETFPRNIFLPWEKVTQKPNLQDEETVLIKINFKKNLGIPTGQILSLFHFVKQFFRTGNNIVIPTMEKWVPDCGLNILMPKLEHDFDYFSDINIFTKFRELEPPQILSLFREMINTPTYAGSPFTAMVENELIKTETTETGITEAVLQKALTKDAETLNYQDDFD